MWKLKMSTVDIWKVEVLSEQPPKIAWALADTAEEALELSGFRDAIVTPMPERYWIAPGRIVWERP